jgi:hypothetical protein
MPKRNPSTGSPPSRFALAVGATPALAMAYRPGLRALKRADAAHVSAPHPIRLTGSVNLDDALTATLPNAARWDYAIGHHPRMGEEAILWVEIHAASGGNHLHEMDAKVIWLLGWLRADAPAMSYTPRRIIWVASGRSSFGGNDPKLRALRNRGLEFVGGHLRL